MVDRSMQKWQMSDINYFTICYSIVMKDHNLTKQQLQKLLKSHRRERDKKRIHSAIFHKFEQVSVN